jgi:hypothetical protein
LNSSQIDSSIDLTGSQKQGSDMAKGDIDDIDFDIGGEIAAKSKEDTFKKEEEKKDENS